MSTPDTPRAVSATKGGARPVPSPPTPFEKPSPGTWTFDASHCERPLPRIVHGVFEDVFARGNREAAAAYGALLDTVECALVNGFMYTCVRPLGAPPEPKGPPPRVLFTLLTWFHPGVRRRLRDSERALERRLWREETEQYLARVAAVEERLRALRAVDVKSLDDIALAEHVSACRALVTDDLYAHYRVNLSRILPVGDLLAHVHAWVGAEVKDTLAALRGSSPSSEEGLAELTALADRVRADPALAERLRRADVDPEAMVTELEQRADALGEAARAWIVRVGHRVTGFSPGYPTLRETPSTLLAALRAAVDDRWTSEAAARGREAADRLRARVPEAHRARYDALMEEARFVYFIRDHATQRNGATFGVLRLATLEVGRRLQRRGRLTDADAALDLRIEDVRPALKGEPVDDGAVGTWHAWRHAATAEHAPERLGPAAGPPPPVAWLPPGPRRLVVALNHYVDAMFGEMQAVERPDDVVVRGLAASPGKRVGVARLVLAPGDFDRVKPGDVLIARMTAPSYNILLPLLVGVVTDRGGVLSHPAIVSREYGIPCVVGTRVGTATIPDGARVEVDGDAGTVRVLA